MRGRPKRIKNELLCTLVEDRRRELGISVSQFAHLLGVQPSTLTRSLNSQAFSKAMTDSVKRVLGKAFDGNEAPTKDVSHEDAFRILQEFVSMAPEIAAALQIVLDARRSLK
jgi:transcriptional regulator with XRE-family HTH domain